MGISHIPKWKIPRHIFVVYMFFWILSKFEVNHSKSLWVLTLWSVPYKRKLRFEKTALREISCFATKLRPQTPSRITWPISALVGWLPVTSWWNFRAISSPNKSYCFALRRNHPLVLACGVLAEMANWPKSQNDGTVYIIKSRTLCRGAKMLRRVVGFAVHAFTSCRIHICPWPFLVVSSLRSCSSPALHSLQIADSFKASWSNRPSKMLSESDESSSSISSQDSLSSWLPTSSNSALISKAPFCSLELIFCLLDPTGSSPSESELVEKHCW